MSTEIEQRTSTARPAPGSSGISVSYAACSRFTLAHAIVFIVSICYLQNFGGAIYLPHSFSHGPANKRRAGPSCDD